MLRAMVVWLAAAPLGAQTAPQMIALASRGIAWNAAPVSKCEGHTPLQMDVYATTEWTHRCTEKPAGFVRESYYYAFGEPAREALLRADIWTSGASLAGDVRARLTATLGAPSREPRWIEISLMGADHWHARGLHWFLYAPMPRGGTQLTVITDSLFAERERDALILRVEGFSGEAREEDDPVRHRLRLRIGEQNMRPTLRDLTTLLRESDGAGRARRALLLLAAHQVTNRLAQTMTEPTPLDRIVSRYGARVHGQTHQGGLDYRSDLLWRVWREFPDTEAGELAFLELQRRGWNTDTGEGCPKNPDFFREVIERGETFLAERPNTDFRRQVIYTLAVANETWWSSSHAKADDQVVGVAPYPRRAENARQGEAARARAIQYYAELMRIAPGSPEAAAAERRLPRLKLRLDTGQRRFFCFYC